ncbi:MAG: PCRF domain-containing protein, partial [Bacteroidia bacterium]
MIEQLEALCRKHDDMALKLADPKVLSDLKQFKKLNQEYKDLDQIVIKIKEYKKTLQDI